MHVLSLAVAALVFSLTLTACKAGSADDKGAPTESSQTRTAAHRVSVVVDERGYTPSEVDAKAGEPITLVFKRTAEQGCAQEVVFPDHGIQRLLPVNEEVAVTLTPKKAERIAFTCGMGMYRGSIVATH